MVLQHCLRIQEDVAAAEQCVDHLLQIPRGLLKICASVTVGQAILSQQLHRFIGLYPEVELVLELTNRRVDLIEEGFDIAIRIGELEDSSLVAKYLGQFERKLCASPTLFIDQQAPSSPEQLSEFPCLLMNNPNLGKQWHLCHQGVDKHIDIHSSIQVNDFYSLKNLCLQGLGITMLPGYLCDNAIKAGELVQVLPQWQCPRSKVYALYPSHRSITPKVRVMLDFLKSLFAESSLKI